MRAGIVAAGLALSAAAVAPAAAQQLPIDPSGITSRFMQMADGMAGEMFAKADANHDGVLTQREINDFSASVGGSEVDPQTWRAADLNHDGYVTLPELKAAMRSMMGSAR